MKYKLINTNIIINKIMDNEYKNINLNNKQQRNKILKYLYSSVNPKINPVSITCQDDIEKIRDYEYIICPKISGINVWIVFIKIDDIYYAVTFAKAEKIKDIRYMNPIDIAVHKDFYTGTIMDGIYYEHNNSKYLIILEVYLLSGKNILLKPKIDRLYYLSQYISKNSSRRPNYQIYVTKYYLCDRNSLKDLYDKIKNDSLIRELIFYPSNFGNKIYCYRIVADDLTDEKIVIQSFIMQKTINSDVYNLIDLDTNKKIGIAYIPDMECSQKCKLWFKHKKIKELTVNCKLHENKNKWIPFELKN